MIEKRYAREKVWFYVNSSKFFFYSYNDKMAEPRHCQTG